MCPALCDGVVGLTRKMGNMSLIVDSIKAFDHDYATLAMKSLALVQ